MGLRAVRFPRECSPVRRPLLADEQTAREKGTFGYPIVEGSSSDWPDEWVSADRRTILVSAESRSSLGVSGTENSTYPNRLIQVQSCL